MTQAAGSNYTLEIDRYFLIAKFLKNIMTSSSPRFLIIGLDSLRPEMISEKNMPNLFQFAEQGVTFENHRCCYPSQTYVNLPSLVTGSVPSQHGIIANEYLDKKVDLREKFNGSSVEKIEKSQNAYQGKLYGVPSFGEILHSQDKSMAVISTNSSGSTRLKHYQIKTCPHLSFACHTPEHSWPPDAVSRIVKKCGRPPTKVFPNHDGITYATDVFLEYLVPDGLPDLTILWHSEPDDCYHNFGVGSDQSLEALSHVDAQFGRVIDWWESSDLHDNLQIIVTSDHAQITQKSNISMSGLLTGEGFKVDNHLEDGADIALVGGYCGNMLFKNDDSGLAKAIGEALMSFDCCGMIFSQDKNGVEGVIPGSFSIKLVQADHARSPDLYYILKTDNELDHLGLKGNCFFDSDQPVGGGTHGGLHPNELHNTCIIQGSLFHENHTISNTSGIIDILPTVLHSLKIPIPKTVNGRILFEAMTGKNDQDLVQESESFKTGQLNFQQILEKTTVNKTSYIDGGWRCR